MHSPDNGTTVTDATRNSGANAQSSENANAANADNTTVDARTAAESSVAEAAESDVQDTTKEASGENPKAETNDNVAETAKNGKNNTSIGSIVKGTTRLASLPAGIMKDLIQGGVIVAGKNFIPRVKNVLQGNSIVNHADVHKKNKTKTTFTGSPGKDADLSPTKPN